MLLPASLFLQASLAFDGIHCVGSPVVAFIPAVPFRLLLALLLFRGGQRYFFGGCAFTRMLPFFYVR